RFFIAKTCRTVLPIEEIHLCPDIITCYNIEEIHVLTIMIERWETLSIIGLIVGGKLIREVSHGGHRTTSGNHSHCGSCFLPCTTKRVQITEVRLTQLVRHLRSNYFEKQSIGRATLQCGLCPPLSLG